MSPSDIDVLSPACAGPSGEGLLGRKERRGPPGVVTRPHWPLLPGRAPTGHWWSSPTEAVLPCPTSHRHTPRARVSGRRRPACPTLPLAARPSRPHWGPSSPVHPEVLFGEDVLHVIPEVPEE